MVDWAAWQGRVVVGVDGSDTAIAAVRWAAQEAASRQCGLTLVASISPPVSAAGFGPAYPPALDLIGILQVQAETMLAEVHGSINDNDIITRVEVGSPSGVLVEASEHAALVVLGSRGRGGFKGLLLGSVGTQVASHAQCPTVILRSEPRADARTVVVGLDESPAAQGAVAFAFDYADRHGLDLVAVHAWEVPAYDLIVVPNAPVPVPLTDVADDEIRLAAEVLAGYRADFPSVRVEERLVRSSPVDALLNAATDAALIVVGTRGHGPAVGAVLGSVSHGVLHKAAVPVAVVPHVEPDGSAA
jgi:nucleotide-binding universal stress UspA family protein